MKHRTRTFLITAALGVGVLALTAPAQATFPGPNGRIAFHNFDPSIGDFALYTADPDGTHVIQVNHVGGFFSSWSADGKHLAYDFFDPDGNEQIATVNPDGSGTQQLTSGPVIHETPAFSPDGSQIIYDYASTFGPDFHTSLWIMNADGSNQHQLVPGSDAFDVEPEFSPDGQSLAFINIRKAVGPRNQSQNALFVSRSDGTDRQQLTAWGQSVELGDGTWSPDGQWITFHDSADIGGSRSIYLIRPDGTGKHVIYQGQRTAEGAYPAFSPDGTEILFICVTHKPSPDLDLCIMNTDGSNVLDITNTRGGPGDPTLETHPSWGTAPLL